MTNGRGKSDRSVVPKKPSNNAGQPAARITRLWSDALFGACDPVVDQLSQRRYDLTIATGPELPFEPDPIRYLPEQRDAFHARIDFADLVVTGDRRRGCEPRVQRSISCSRRRAAGGCVRSRDAA